MMQRHDGPIDQRMLNGPESCLDEITALACRIRGIETNIRPETRIAKHIGLLDLPGFWGGVHEMCPKRIPRFAPARIERYFDSFLCTKWAIAILFMAACIAYTLTIAWIEYFNPSEIIYTIYDPMGIHVICICIYMTFHVAGILFLIILMARILVPLTFGSLRFQFGHLPHGIETFGELADLVSGNRGGWCLNCGYDMTGIAAERCPECGRENAVS